MIDRGADTLIRLKEVLALLPIGRSTWYAGIRTGRFPKPVKLGQRVSAYRLRDILALIERGQDAE
jgi:predicted DNA-binding transcriptional regulator AlpA